MNAESYFVRRGESVEGPFSTGQLKVLVGAGRINPSTLVSADQADWQPLSCVVGLTRRTPEGLAAVGWALVILGVVGATYFAVVFETAVAGVNNAGLMQAQLIGVMMNMGAVLCGTILLASQAIISRIK
jgi:hypothetical protein